MESQVERKHRIHRNIMLIVAIMSVIVAIFVIGVAVSYPEGLGGALVMGLIAVVTPVIGYLYTARWYAMLDN